MSGWRAAKGSRSRIVPSTRSPAVPGPAFRCARLLDAGAERHLGDPAVSQRFVCVSDDAALAMALIDASVRTALRAWPDEQVSIHVGTPDLRVRLGFARLDDAAIERIVDLGLRLVRAGRAAGLSHRAA